MRNFYLDWLASWPRASLATLAEATDPLVGLAHVEEPGAAEDPHLLVLKEEIHRLLSERSGAAFDKLELLRAAIVEIRERYRPGGAGRVILH